MDKLKYVKIENEDGSLSDNIPLGVDAENVDISDTKTLNDKLTEIDTNINSTRQSIGTLSTQINNIVADAGTEGSSSSEIVAARVDMQGHTYNSLGERLTTLEQYSGATRMTHYANADFNTFLLPGKYVITSLAPEHHGPEGGRTSGILIVEGLDSRNNFASVISTPLQWLVQRFYGLNKNNPEPVAERIIQKEKGKEEYIYLPWFIPATKITTEQKLSRKNLEDTYNTYDQTSMLNYTDLDEITATGIYIVDNPLSLKNTPESMGGVLIVETWDSNQKFNSNNNRLGSIWTVQFYLIDDTSLHKGTYYVRIIRRDHSGVILFPNQKWIKIGIDYSFSWGLNNKNVINFGDSIFGNKRDASSISYWISKCNGANVYNQGYGGCRMSDRGGTTWNAFSFCNLVDAIVSGNYSWQEEVVSNNKPGDMPSYFIESLNQLKEIDWNSIDYITISYGTNDYTAGISLDNDNDLYDKKTVLGALRYSIKALLSKYPHLRILVGTPLWRCWLNSEKTEIQETSDTKIFAPSSYTLLQQADAIKECCKKMHIPVLDMYNELGLNEYNWKNFFTNKDTTHPTAIANRRVARHWAYRLCDI